MSKHAKTLRTPGRLVLIACLSFALAGAWSGATFAAFRSNADNPGNTVTAAPDWTAPAINGGGVGKATGPLGYASDGDTVHMYLDITETGNPASGIATVTAISDVPGGGQMSFQMNPGSWTVRGQRYNYRSDPVVIPAGFSAQTLTVNTAATDNAGNSSDRDFPFTVDNTAPGVSAAGVTTANGGGTLSRIQQNDAIAFNFTETMDAESILAGWTGGAQNITVRLNNAAAGGNDQLTFYDQNNAGMVALGSVNLGRADYTNFNRTFGNSSMSLAGNRITVIFGTASGGVTTAGGSATMVWTTPTAATDLAGNPMSGANWTEPAPFDRDF